MTIKEGTEPKIVLCHALIKFQLNL